MKIKKVLLCGLGAVGLTYANKLKDVCELKIVADTDRIEKYLKKPPKLNNVEIKLNYILPSENWNPDLIIVSTKSYNLDSAIDCIKGFVKDNTIILSLINGISSENKIAEIFGKEKVLHSYFIGHSAVRKDNLVFQDGVGRIVFGSPYKENRERVESLKEFFKENSIDYELPNDIIYSMWLKYTLNVFSNQSSAIMNLTFGEMKSESFKNFAKKIIREVISVAEKEEIKNAKKLEENSLKALSGMVDDGETSMLQDILAGRKTEADIFAGEIIRLGEKHKIKTPYNQVMYDMIKTLEEIKK